MGNVREGTHATGAMLTRFAPTNADYVTQSAMLAKKLFSDDTDHLFNAKVRLEMEQHRTRYPPQPNQSIEQADQSKWLGSSYHGYEGFLFFTGNPSVQMYLHSMSEYRTIADIEDQSNAVFKQLYDSGLISGRPADA